MITVKEMMVALKKLPPDASLFIEVDAYYHEGDREDESAVDLPVLVLTQSGFKVRIGSIFAQP